MHAFLHHLQVWTPHIDGLKFRDKGDRTAGAFNCALTGQRSIASILLGLAGCGSGILSSIGSSNSSYPDASAGVCSIPFMDETDLRCKRVMPGQISSGMPPMAVFSRSAVFQSLTMVSRALYAHLPLQSYQASDRCPFFLSPVRKQLVVTLLC